MTAQYSPAVVADLECMLRQGLGRWGLAECSRLTLLNLSENATFLAEDVDRDAVFRLHRLGYSSDAEITSELAWIAALQQDGVIDTATPLPATDGRLLQCLDSPSGRPARRVVAFQRLPGRAPATDPDQVPWFVHLGRISARLHAHARSWSRPPGFQRPRWDFAAMVGRQARWGPWRAALGLDSDGARIIEAALALIGARLEAYGQEPQRFGLVHGDLRSDNLLQQDGRLSVLDFDDCGFSWFVYDFAAAISFIEEDPGVPALRDAWLRGYRQVAPLPDADLAEIPTFVALRRILLTAWLASHSEVPLAQRLGAGYTAGTVRLARQLLAGTLLTGTER
jgi:Ser/Thr protein kinase RdoA (MazF antagonist)